MKQKTKERKPFTQTNWFRAAVLICLFLPLYTQSPYDPQQTPDLIYQVLSHPLTSHLEPLMSIFKLGLLLAVLSPLFLKRRGAAVVLAYYTFLLFIVGALQNTTITENYGFVWIVGNTIVHYMLAVICLVDICKRHTQLSRHHFDKSKLWIAPLMLLALLMPYGVSADGNAIPDISMRMLTNDAALTFCMITPVVIGTLLLFWRGVHRPTLAGLSFVGAIFGIINGLLWFTLRPESWWMGVLHLPLLIISTHGLAVARRNTARRVI